MEKMSSTSSTRYGKYQFALAGPEDNTELLGLLRANPIHMEMDYIMDKKDDFLKINQILPGSIVVLARNTDTNKVVGCLSLLKMNGDFAGEELSFQYITNLIKSSQEDSSMLMKKMLNYTFENFFDTSLVFGLINDENRRARMFSAADILHYRGKHTATMYYFELVPLAIQKIPSQYICRAAANYDDLLAAFHLINEHYKHHLLYRTLDMSYWDTMCNVLPSFGLDNLWMVFENNQLQGAMIYYNPVAIGTLILARLDRKTKILLKAIRFVHKVTGLLFSPPLQGEEIKSLQVRYLAGHKAIQNVMLRVANNIAYRQKLHSVALLTDIRDAPSPSNMVMYRYSSLLYAGYKQAFSDKITLFNDRPVFFDITYS